MTATHRHATVTKKFDFAAVSEPYTATIYDGAVTNRHVISYPLRVCAHARGKDLRAMRTVATAPDGKRSESELD